MKLKEDKRFFFHNTAPSTIDSRKNVARGIKLTKIPEYQVHIQGNFCPADSSRMLKASYKKILHGREDANYMFSVTQACCKSFQQVVTSLQMTSRNKPDFNELVAT